MRRFLPVSMLFIATLLRSAAAAAPDHDLVLRGGRIADGSGNPLFHADIAISAGRITAIGRITGAGREEIDARNLVVAPGFIDVHTHADDVAELPLAENFTRMGVTTVIAGNCGSSAVDIARFFREIEATNVAVNVTTLIGHGSVRGQVMGGSFARPPSAEELGRMQELVRQGMRDGAVGLSTGLIYLPGTFAKTEELIALASAAGEFDGTYASHMRGEGRDIFKSLDELFRIAREGRIRAQVSHLKLSGKSAWGRTADVVAAIEQARVTGLDITQDQYVYTAASTGISQLIPQEYREGNAFSNNLAQPAVRDAMIAEMKRRLADRGQTNYAYAVIASYRANPKLNGLNLVDAARKARGADTLDAQIDLILEIQSRGGASGVFHGISEDDLQVFARHPHTMFASDSGVRKFRDGVPHPRGYGNNARVLGRYVRELGVLRLEDAIRRMTSLPASTFRLADRGILRPGAWADVVVFDPARVGDEATFDDPHHYAVGFAAVLVNGVTVVRRDETTGQRPGKALRHAGLLR